MAKLMWCTAAGILLLLLLHLQGTRGQSATSNSNTRQPVTCHCNQGNNCNRSTNTCTTFLPGQCATKVQRLNGNITKLDQFCPAELVACESGPKRGGYSWFCCDGSDFCGSCPNLADLGVTEAELRGLGFNFLTGCVYEPAATISVRNMTTVSTPIIPVKSPTRPLWLAPVIVLAIILILAILLGIFVCFYIATRRCHFRSVDIDSVGNCSSLSLSYGLGPSMSGSSGAGVAMLQAQTFSNMITVKERIGKGGFGCVWSGVWAGRQYAIKKFPSTLYKSWEREGAIYKTCMISHDSILRFICMETEDRTYGVDYWLVFDYHHNGALSSYIKKNTLTKSEILRFLISISSGLSYLHYRIPTSTADKKPILAHRDLKPSNILIKDDMTCCIADLGLTVREADFVNGKEYPDPFVGTKRYLAPEILGKTIQRKSIESYVRADVYSFALIMWEVCSRCEWHGNTHPHQIPYHNLVPNDPTLEDMCKVVVTQKVRPTLDPGWKNDEVLREFSGLMYECWREIPESRLTMMRVKADLEEIMLESAIKSNE